MSENFVLFGRDKRTTLRFEPIKSCKLPKIASYVVMPNNCRYRYMQNQKNESYVIRKEIGVDF